MKTIIILLVVVILFVEEFECKKYNEEEHGEKKVLVKNKKKLKYYGDNSVKTDYKYTTSAPKPSYVYEKQGTRWSLNNLDLAYGGKNKNSQAGKYVIKRSISQDSLRTGNHYYERQDEVQFPVHHGSKNIQVIPKRNETKPRGARSREGSLENLQHLRLKNDTFGDNAYKNMITGLSIWIIMSKMHSESNYNVYTHYNKPTNFPDEFNLTANFVMMCNETIESLCFKGSKPVCTADKRMYCVIDFEEAIKCVNEETKLCAKLVIPCENDAKCQNDIMLPCLNNINVKVNIKDVNLKYCAVSMSIPNRRM